MGGYCYSLGLRSPYFVFAVEETSCDPDHSFDFGSSFFLEVLASEPNEDHWTVFPPDVKFFSHSFLCQGCLDRFSPTTGLGVDLSPGAFSGSFEEL